MNQAAINVGRMAKAAPADMGPHCIFIEPQNAVNPTDIVLACIRVNRNAKRNSFQAKTRQKTAVIAAPDLIKGKTTFRRIVNRP